MTARRAERLSEPRSLEAVIAETRKRITRYLHGVGDPSCAGHGTHVAGIVGGLRYGVAKDVNIIMVEVQPCTGSGSLRYLLKGLDWLLDNAKLPAVAQMSLVALGKSHSLNSMVQEVIDAGIPFVVSAGNYGADVVNFSPAMLESAIVVGNVDSRDVLQEKSNYGKTVDLFAPGVSIISASAADNTGFKYLTGTSQAAPHVSGVVAQYLERQPKATPKEVERHLIRTAAKDKIPDTKGSPNRILQTDLNSDIPILVQEEESVISSIEPQELRPVVLFKSPGSERGSRALSVANKGPGSLEFIAKIADRMDGSTGSWITAIPYGGSLEPGKTAEIKIRIDATDLAPGVYEASVVVQTNDINRLVTRFPVKLYVFCGRLAPGKHLPDRPFFTSTGIRNQTEGSRVTYTLSGVIRFHKPILSVSRMQSAALPRAVAVSGACINDTFYERLSKRNVAGGGAIEMFDDYGDMCSAFSLRVSAVDDRSSVSEEQERADFCIDILEDQVADVYGTLLPETRICVPLNAEKRSVQWFGANMIYASDEGLVTNETRALLIIIFSAAIQHPLPSLFLVQPVEAAHIAVVKPMKPENRTYEIQVQVKEDYYGSVNITLLDDVYDGSARRLDLEEVPIMVFKRTATSIVEHKGYMIKEQF